MIIAQISDTHVTQVGGKADRKYATATHLPARPRPPHPSSGTPGCRAREWGLCG